MAFVGTPKAAKETIGDTPKSIKAITKRPTARFYSLRHPSLTDFPSKFVSMQTQDSGCREREYWNRVANDILDKKGVIHLRTAETLLQLGNSHMCCEEYKDALTVFKAATRIFRKINGDFDLSVALALAKVGQAACRLSKRETNLRNALEALNESLLIRHEILGPAHVDTIDTLNNMAGVYYRLRCLSESRQAYYEVWTMRQVVFGPNHPSVAVTAHALGSVNLHLYQVDEASKFYCNALDVYRHLNLSEEHPSVIRLLSDIDLLEHAMSTSNNGK